MGSVDKYQKTRRRGDILYVVVTLLCVYAVERMGAAAAPILATALPMMLAHAAAHSHTTNKMEKKGE